MTAAAPQPSRTLAAKEEMPAAKKRAMCLDNARPFRDNILALASCRRAADRHEYTNLQNIKTVHFAIATSDCTQQYCMTI